VKSLLDLKHLKVDEFTTACLTTAKIDTKINELIKLMDDNDIRHIPIIENNEAIGIVSDRDVKNLATKEWAQELTASDVMVRNPYSVRAGTSLKEVVSIMSTHRLGSALVNDKNGKTYGIFTSVDALNALIEIL
jgi:predicted transcriptional regulator